MRKTVHNSGLAKGGVWCFYESLVLNPNFVLPMKFSAVNPALRQAADRYASPINESANKQNDSADNEHSELY
jgi:hypothetical protein